MVEKEFPYNLPPATLPLEIMNTFLRKGVKLLRSGVVDKDSRLQEPLRAGKSSHV